MEEVRKSMVICYSKKKRGKMIYSKGTNKIRKERKLEAPYIYSPPSETKVLGNHSTIMAPRDVTCADFEDLKSLY